MKNVMSCINELEKEKPLKKNVEEIGAKFKTNLTKIESELTKQLDYLGNVCVGSEHQGSLFISQQNMELAAHAVNSLHAQLADISNETFQKETFQDDHR
uniref:Mediator complex subunit 11 n=1 Tax=Acrobeloides nanus TaxID=290746 RepID=A0A914DWX9_9BILA